MIQQIVDPSNYSFSLYALPVAIVGLLTAALGVGVLITERASRLGLIFAGVTWSAALWLLAFALIYSATNAGVARWWISVEHLGVAFIPSTVYIFTLSIVRQLRAHRWPLLLSIFLSLLFFLSVAFGDEFVTGVQGFAWGFYPQYGSLSLLFLSFFLLAMVVSLRHLRRGNQHAQSSAQRERLRAFFVAFIIAYLGSADYFAAYGVPLYPFGYLPVFVFLVLSARAIRRYRLIDITPEFAAKTILDIMTDALIVLDHEGIVRVVNQAACKLFGRAAHELTRTRAAQLDPHFFQAPPTEPRLDNWHYEVSLPTASEGVRVMSISACTMRDARDKPTAVIYLAHDITNRKRAEEEIAERNQALRQLSQRLLEVQENERTLLAADLHDTVVQWLSGTLYRIEVVRQLSRHADGDALNGELATVEKTLQRSIDELRLTIMRLHPPELEMHGLVASLTQHIEQWRRQTNIYIEFDVRGERASLPRLMETGLYRICQEALNNVAKHAQASEVNVALTYAPDQVTLCVQDNGIGFDQRRTSARRAARNGGVGAAVGTHVGLLAMQERAALIGGKLTVESAPGAGTTLTVSVPRTYPTAENHE